MSSITLQHILSGQPQPKYVELQSMNFNELLTKFGLDTVHPEKYKLVRRLADGQIGVLDITEQSNPNKMENKFFTDKYTNEVILGPTYSETYMVFEDPEVKRICVENFGGVSGITNSVFGTVGIPGKAGEVSYEQILAVTNLKTVFSGNKIIRKFNELLYFTNVVNLNQREFEGCLQLEEITLPNYIISSALIFTNCKNLRKLRTPYGLRLFNCSYIFQNCNSLETLDVTNWDVSGCDSLFNMFNGCSSLKNIDVSNWNVSRGIDFKNMFLGCSSLETLNVTNWDVSKAQQLSYMFSGCTKLKTLNVTNWDVSNVKDFVAIFYNCTSLKILDVYNWNLKNALTINSMFYGCSNLLSLNISGWNVSKVIDINNLFYGCSKLQELDLNSWDVSKVQTMLNLFYNCLNLEDLNVSNWDVSNVTNCNNCFNMCTKLREIDISNWKLKITGNLSIFLNCNSLENIIGGEIDTSLLSAETPIFQNCPQIRNFSFKLLNCDFDLIIYGRNINYECLENIKTNPSTVIPKTCKVQIPIANVPQSFINQWENARNRWTITFI